MFWNKKQSMWLQQALYSKCREKQTEVIMSDFFNQKKETFQLHFHRTLGYSHITNYLNKIYCTSDYVWIFGAFISLSLITGNLHTVGCRHV